MPANSKYFPPYGEKIVKFLDLKNKHLIIFLPLLGISWLIYINFFLDWFEYKWRFLPTFLMGFLSCLLMAKFFKKKLITKVHLPA